MSRTFAAVDLGASSGRVILGHLDRDQVRMRHVSRFANDTIRVQDGLYWNTLELYRQVLHGLADAERLAPGEVRSVGVDSWAVDYGLLRAGRLLGGPRHYRDDRNAEGVQRVHAQISAEELFARNGLQHLPFNTMFQVATEGALLDLADRLLLVPDLLSFWLTGVEVTERTNASTTGLLDPRTQEWDLDLARLAGLPPGILPALVDPGTPLGRLTPHVADAVGRDLQVVTVASHDTASAVVAVPNTGRDFAYVSCGTWGLVGLELDAPVLTEAAREAGFTNEGGLDGRTRFLHNVMGLWLLSESLRQWEPSMTSAQRSSLLSELLEDAAKVDVPVAVFDVDHPMFLPPGDIPGRLRNWCRAHDQPVPSGRAEVVRSIVESLAHAFASAVLDACELADHEVNVIHVLGGGAQNTLLCQSLAERSGLPVLAGPVEATALGNILVQTRAAHEAPADLTELRRLAEGSTTITRYLP